MYTYNIIQKIIYYLKKEMCLIYYFYINNLIVYRLSGFGLNLKFKIHHLIQF